MAEHVVELRVLREQVEREHDRSRRHRAQEELERRQAVRQHEADDLAGRDPPRFERGVESRCAARAPRRSASRPLRARSRTSHRVARRWPAIESANVDAARFTRRGAGDRRRTARPRSARARVGRERMHDARDVEEVPAVEVVGEAVAAPPAAAHRQRERQRVVEAAAGREAMRLVDDDAADRQRQPERDGAVRRCACAGRPSGPRPGNASSASARATAASKSRAR